MQYGYEYNGRVATGIKELKGQYGLVNINGHIIIQSLGEDSLIVKVETNARQQ